MSEAKRAQPASFRDVFAVGEFRALWLAEVQSVLGDQLARVAISVLVFDRTGSAGLTSLTYALTFVPDLIGGPLLSGLADRFPRRLVMVSADLLRAVLIGLMAIPTVPLAVLAVLLVAAQLCNSPFAAAQAATVPNVLKGDSYILGQTVRQMTTQIGQLVGFVLAGVLVALIGSHQALAIDAATFLISAVVIRFGLAHRPAVADDGSEPVRSVFHRMAAGARIIWHDRRLRSLVGLGWLVGFAIVPEGLAVPYTHDEIHAGPAAAGLLLAAVPAGTVIGAFVLGRFVAPERRLRLLGPLAVLTTAPLMAFVLRPGLIPAILLLLAVGLFSAYQVTAGATFMRIVPDAGRGQAFGLAGSGVIAAQGLGLAAGGLLASVLGSVAVTIAVAGAAGTLLAVPAATAWRRARTT
ncbi:MAG TPA: MFS transporter [Pseudonocardiaceae bacterium]|nr:MFS transporter [Pseudonocardiaceae bacterium]